MIQYDYGDYSVGFAWQLEGSTILLSAVFALPAALQAVLLRYAMITSPWFKDSLSSFESSASWTTSYVVLGLLLGFRINKAYARFWEGMTLVQQMRAEWFESCSNLMAFSNVACMKEAATSEAAAAMTSKVSDFQYTLVRLMSLMHGAALRQIGGSCEEFDVLDIHGLDSMSMEYLTDFCTIHEINRVEVLLHWIQVLITENISTGVLVVPPPILTRAYQTLSRGMVNLHDVRKLADIPFPFPLSQMIILMLLMQSVITPFYASAVFQGVGAAAVFSFLPLWGMWSITFIANQMEQPFGQDANDLPLSNLQFEMNNSLLMLLDDCTQRAPKLKPMAHRTVECLREGFGDPLSRTDSFNEVFSSGPRNSSLKSSRLIFKSQFQKTISRDSSDGTAATDAEETGVSDLSEVQVAIPLPTPPTIAVAEEREVKLESNGAVGEDRLLKSLGEAPHVQEKSDSRDTKSPREKLDSAGQARARAQMQGAARLRSPRKEDDDVVKVNLHSSTSVEAPPQAPRNRVSGNLLSSYRSEEGTMGHFPLPSGASNGHFEVDRYADVATAGDRKLYSALVMASPRRPPVPRSEDICPQDPIQDGCRDTLRQPNGMVPGRTF
eukprot:TRINITY_DN3195_c1_g3_i1.p1 TRINITY_DN3195_c1_g3~~TRINITY_DN3195_c1_g3_i1.p1  ORF type:complete len:609 (+),score=102.76 TRINITY_DN3195_c1_g3_i1:80-1906(+)